MKRLRANRDVETRRPIRRIGRLRKLRTTTTAKAAGLIRPFQMASQVRHAGWSRSVLMEKLLVPAMEIQSARREMRNLDVVRIPLCPTESPALRVEWNLNILMRLPEPKEEPSLSARLKMPRRVEPNKILHGKPSRSARIPMPANERNPNVLRRKQRRNGELPSQVHHARLLSPTNLRLLVKLNIMLRPEVVEKPVTIVNLRANKSSEPI